MKMTIEAQGPEEIKLLSAAVASALADTTTAQVAQTTGAEVGENSETMEVAIEVPVKKGRGRPKKTATPEVSADPVAVDTPDTEVEYEPVVDEPVVSAAPVVDLVEFRNAVVKKSDEPGMQDKVVQVLKRFTTDGSPKTANVPEGKRQEVLDELAKLQVVE